MAEDADGTLIDPWGGRRDLSARLLRHVSPAFAEDPVRILRVARFAARFGDFSVAPDTALLMRQMVRSGEVDALVAERVWQELSRGLMEPHPSRMFDVLQGCGALARLLPEVDADWGDTPEVTAASRPHLRHALDAAAHRQAPLPVRFAVLTHRLGSMPSSGGPGSLPSLCERWRIPTDCRELAELLLRERDAVQRSAAMDAEALVGLLDSADAWRRPERFELLLQACDIIARAHAKADAGAPQRSNCRLRSALQHASAIDTSVIAQRAAAAGERGPAIGTAIHQARVLAVADALSDEDND
jgi:tRNA nucleotidyltransferase (CCA-adding enzyme)